MSTPYILADRLNPKDVEEYKQLKIFAKNPDKDDFEQFVNFLRGRKDKEGKELLHSALKPKRPDYLINKGLLTKQIADKIFSISSTSKKPIEQLKVGETINVPKKKKTVRFSPSTNFDGKRKIAPPSKKTVSKSISKQIPKSIPKEDFIVEEDFKNWLNSNPNQIEVEARIGKFNAKNNFISNTPSQLFNNLKTSLMNMTKNTLSMNAENLKTKVFTTSEITQNSFVNYLKIEYEGNIIFRTKEGRGKVDKPEWGIRLAQSKEENITKIPDRIKFDERSFRIKNRTRFYDSNEESPIYGVYIDMTLVEATNENGSTFRTHEIEIERKEKLSAEKFIKALKFIYFMYQGLDQVFFTIDYNKEKLVEDHFHLIMNQPERKNIINAYNNLTGKQPEKGEISYYRNEPRNIKIKDFIHMPNYAVTSKLDGMRKHLFIHNKQAYLINPPYDIFKVSDKANLERALFDGELVGNELFIFDVAFVKNTNATEKQLHTRLDLIEETDIFVENIKISTKTFYNTGNIYNDVEAALKENKNFEDNDIKTDGLIFQPIKGHFVNSDTFKWKPVDNLTIDFMVEQIWGEKENIYNLSVAGKGRIVAFRGTRKFPYLKTVSFKNNAFKDEPMSSGRILEFKWDKKSENFVPIKFRDDKPSPNRADVAINVWEDIMEPIYEETIQGKDLVIMRKYHNMIKDHLITTYINRGSTILDIGTGRGGDLSKWKNRNINAFAVEPDKKNVETIKERNKTVNANIKIINAGAEETTEILKNVDEVDAISAFFSLTFFPESEEIFDGLINTIDRTLKKNGYLVGIVLDEGKLREFAKNNDMIKTKKYENSAFSLRKGKWNKEPFNNKLWVDIKDKNSMVKNVEEYLFRFSYFVERLREIGIHLYRTEEEEESKYKESFISKNIGFLSPDAQEFSKFNRCFVFKRFKKEVIKEHFLNKGKQSVRMKFGIEDDLVQVACIDDESSLFHAVFKASSKEYNKLDYEGKQKFIRDVRRSLGYNLTIEQFEKLGGGILTRNLVKSYNELLFDDEKSKKVSFEKFKLMIMNNKEWVGDNLEIIQLLSDFIKRNIYITDVGTRDVYLPEADRKISFKSRCNMLYKDRPSIILLTDKGVKFNIIVRGNKSVFPKGDNVIKELHTKLCDKGIFQKEQAPELFNRWSIVKFEDGELKGQGRVVSYDNETDNVKVTPMNPVLSPVFFFNSEQVQMIDYKLSDRMNRTKIKRGNWKGYEGTIINRSGSSVIVKLDSNNRNVTIPKEYLLEAKVAKVINGIYQGKEGDVWEEEKNAYLIKFPKENDPVKIAKNAVEIVQ